MNRIRTLLLTITMLASVSYTNAQITLSVDTLPFQQIASGDGYIFSYKLSAQNLSEALEVSVPVGQGFRISEDGYNFSYTLTLNPSQGEIPETELFVKFMPTQQIEYSIQITHSSSELTKILPVSGIGIEPGGIYVVTNPFEVNFGEVLIGADSITEYWYHFVNEEWPQVVTIYYPYEQGFTNAENMIWISILVGGQSGYYTIKFSPQSVGFFEGNILIEADSGTSTTIHLTGYGVTQLNNILSFSVSEQTTNAVIDIINHTVDIEVETGTDLTNLIPEITISNNATINPPVGTAQDFSVPFEYTVTSQNNEEQIWTVNVSTIVSVNEIEKQFSIYPNPSNGIFTLINLKAFGEPLSVEIIDITGKIIYNQQFANRNSQFVIDISNQPKGIYFLKITCNKQGQSYTGTEIILIN